MYIEGARKPEQTIRYELPFKSLELMIQDLEFECQVIGSGSEIREIVRLFLKLNVSFLYIDGPRRSEEQ